MSHWTLWRTTDHHHPYFGHGSWWAFTVDHAQRMERLFADAGVENLGVRELYRAEVDEVIDDDVLALPPDLYNIQDVVSLDRLAERLAERQGRRPYRWVRFDVGPVEGAIHTEVMYLGDEPVPAVEECRADERARDVYRTPGDRL